MTNFLKSLPLSVIFSIIVLLLAYIALWITCPGFTAFITSFILIGASFVRIISYFMDKEYNDSNS